MLSQSMRHYCRSSAGVSVIKLSYVPRNLVSATSLVRVAGELVAKAYKAPQTGYKSPSAYGTLIDPRNHVIP